MIKNISDKTLRLEFGNIYLTELPPGWNFTFAPEIEDFLVIKYSGQVIKVNEKGEEIKENALTSKVLEITKPKEEKPETSAEEEPETPLEEEPTKKRGKPKKR